VIAQVADKPAFLGRIKNIGAKQDKQAEIRTNPTGGGAAATCKTKELKQVMRGNKKVRQFALKTPAEQKGQAGAEQSSSQELTEEPTSDQDRLKEAWKRIAYRLRTELGEDLYSSWFARMEPVAFDQGGLVVSVPTRFLKNWIQSHYLERVTAACREELRDVATLEIRVRTRGVPAPQEKDKASSAKTLRHDVMQDNQPGTPGAGWLKNSTPLDRAMSFETFIIGKSNALAHAAALRVAEAQPGAALSFNPLYIHSPSGCGKTHLLNAIAWATKGRSPERKVFFLSAERFMYFFVSALQNRDMLRFKDFFRGIDVLLIDDFQFLHGRSMQQEFCHTFNSLVDSHRQVIVAADMPPGQLDSIDTRMRSRLAGGLVLDIEPADFDLRLAILRARVADAIKRDTGFDLSHQVVEFIARRIQGGGRELEGALKRVWAHQQLVQTPITVELAELAIRDLMHAVKPRRISIDDILREIGRHFNVAKSDLLSPRRARSIVRPRQIGMYLAKQLTTRSLPEIGRRFGGRDHSTVLHAIRKINELMSSDEELVKEIGELTRKLQQ
jgi:chromosomal replication initiator protein